MRAEPISFLYEKQRVLHRRGLDQLEGEMMAFSREWDRAVDGSPNRLDAFLGSLPSIYWKAVIGCRRDHATGVAAAAHFVISDKLGTK